MSTIEHSICIVSKNRKKELARTLTIISDYVENSPCEMLVFLDGCSDGSESLIEFFPHVHWEVATKSVGASRARRKLFQNVNGSIIIGFDDDAHPLQHDFMEKASSLLAANPTVAVLSFEEIKGIFENDTQAMNMHEPDIEYECNSFVGCGYAIRKKAYLETDGFPDWMDIYGEEGAVSIQILEHGHKILYTSAITVNHRVDRELRKSSHMNATRFQKQLCNSALYFVIYYPLRLLPVKLVGLFWHNAKKYAFSDSFFFWAYVKGSFRFLSKIAIAIQKRNPVSKQTIRKSNKLPHPKYG